MKHFVLIFSLIAFPALAQQKMLTMEDAVLYQYGKLSPDRLQQLQWVKGTNLYSYIDNKDGESTLFIGDATNENQASAKLSISDLNKALETINGPECKRFPNINWKDANSFEFEDKQNLYTFNLSEGTALKTDSLEIPSGAQNLETAPQTGYVAFTIDNDLFVLKGDEVIPVSVNENKGIVSGQTVSRSEFGIYKGTFWSPDGSKLAYYVKDESQVADYPIIDWTAKPASTEMIKYPMAGTDKTEKISLKVYDFNTGENITIKTGEPNTQYLTNIGWNPTSDKVYIAHLNRDQNHMELKRYDTESGDFEAILFEEKSYKYVEPLQPVHFVKGQQDLFIWESSRSGFNHLYLYNTKGKLVRQLTKGNWTITDFEGFDKDGNVYYTSTEQSPINRDLYRVSLKGKKQRLTTTNGTNMPSLNDDKTYFINNFSNTATPWTSSIFSTERKEVAKIHEAKDPTADYDLGRIRLFTIADKDGGDLHCRMYYPTDFDSTKTYPVVVYLYGGPHAQMIRNYWNGGGNLWFQYMAQQGYVVWTLDNRGSGNRGLAWEQNTFRQLGTVEMEDQMQGIEYLKSKSFVDTTRMGIHGWSFGGFMTMSMMSRQPGIFRAGVAGGPVIDWSYYEVMYTERYMDTPEQNPEGYEANNLINHIDELEGKLLIIHGTSDDVVLWQHTQQYLKACVEKGKQVDYFVYPMHKHNVRGKDRVHLMQKVTDYFNDFL